MKRTLRRSIDAPTAWIRARRKEPTMRKVVLLLAVGAALGAPGVANADTGCPPDSVKVGTACIDLYEASVWSIPAANTNLIAKVQAGTATLADLTGDGATQLNPAYLSFPCSSNYPANFPSDGNWTPILGSSPPSPGVANQRSQRPRPGASPTAPEATSNASSLPVCSRSAARKASSRASGKDPPLPARRWESIPAAAHIVRNAGSPSLVRTQAAIGVNAATSTASVPGARVGC